MPASFAISTPIASLHCSGRTKKSLVVEVDLGAGDRLRAHDASSSFARMALAGHAHLRCDAGNVPAGEQRVPVQPLEHQLPEVVQPRLLQQRHRPCTSGEVAGKRLGVVVEVDQQRLVEAGLDEAVRVSVVGGVERLARRGSAATFSSSTSPSKCVTEPAFEIGTLAASPSTKTFGAASDCSVCGSAGTKFRSSPKPG